MKRLFDIIASGCGLIILSPLLLFWLSRLCWIARDRCSTVVRISESRIVRLDKVSYLCTVILNYSNYGTRQETIKHQAKVRRGCNR